MANNYNGMVGLRVPKGFTKHKMPDMAADAERIPACILVDTSSSMSQWSALLKEASVRMIEAIAEDEKAKEKVDLEVITFNTEEQVCVKIEAQELYNLIDEATGKIKPDFEQRLQFNCSGATPTAYAIAVAVDDLRNRYEKLKEASKAPKSPILFVLSDGLPEVQDDIRPEHDKLLAEQLARIKQLVGEDRLSVIAVKIGRICEEPQTTWQKKHYPEMHQLMQDITGLDNDHHVRMAKDTDDIAKFFEFTSTLVKESASGKVGNINSMDLRNEHSEL